MAEEISEERQLLIAARQWLQLLVDEFDVDPEGTSLDVSAAGPEGKRLLAKVTLADTFARMEAIGVTAQSIGNGPGSGI